MVKGVGEKEEVMEGKKRYSIKIVMFLLVVVTLTLSLFFFKSTLTGLIVYEEQEETKIWDFSTPADYTYNNSLIEIVNDEVNLIATTTITHWNTTTETEYSLQFALYNPSDKTTKVNQLDNKKQEVKNDKIFDIFFSENFDNNEIISLYIKDGNEGDLYLCDKGTLCDSPGYGLIYYDDEEGWYNITISGLSNGVNIFNLRVPEKAKIDYITSTKGDINKALYNPSDKTTKVNQLDNTNFEINKNKIFNLIFDQQINNDDILSLYLKSGSASEVYLCAYGESCSSPGYGSVDYDGEKGWYNITVTNLDQSKNAFNLDPEKVKVDYVKVTNTEIEEHSSTNTTYPSSAEIITADFSPTNLHQWGIFSSTEQLNEQNIQFQYSVDSGETWHDLPENKDLSSVNYNTIKIKATFSSNQTATPVLREINLNYITQFCTEDWSCTNWSPEICPINETQTKSCTDSHECGTEENKPAEIQSCTYIPICTENWTVSYGECLINGSKSKYYTDQNECGTINNLPADNNTYVECDYCSLNNCSNSFQDVISFYKNEAKEIDALDRTNTKLEINSNSSENAEFTIVGYNWTAKEIPSEITALNKYLEIESNATNFNSIKISIYYSDEEILNIDEETLKINYYNETSEEWEELESVVNTDNNYVYAVVDHLSLYGLFGEEEGDEETGEEEDNGEDTQSGSFSISRKYGRSAKRDVPIIEETEDTTELENSNLENELSLDAECDYKLDISLPEIIPLFKQDSYIGEITNKGNCDIPKLNIHQSPELTFFASFSPSTIENLNPGDKKTFQIIRNNKDEKKWFSYLTSSAVAEKIMIKKIKGTIILEGQKKDEILFANGFSLDIKTISTEKVVSTVKKVSLVTIGFFAILVMFLLSFRSVKKRK